MDSLPQLDVGFVANFFYYSAACQGHCKGYSLISNYVTVRPDEATNRGDQGAHDE
jgi:hypothetical protein